VIVLKITLGVTDAVDEGDLVGVIVILVVGTGLTIRTGAGTCCRGKEKRATTITMRKTTTQIMKVVTFLPDIKT
jgi:hypothetical protein